MKKEILFDRNHINIYCLSLNHSDVERRNILNYKWNKNDLLMDNGKMSDHYYKIQETRKESKLVTEKHKIPCLKEVIKVSPLGFYYVRYQENGYREDKGKTIDTTLTTIEYVYTLNDIEYHISYPKRIGDTKLSQDTRPWMLMDGSMDEHYVSDLLKVLNDIKEDIYNSEKKHHMMKFNSPELRWRKNQNERYKTNGCVPRDVIIEDWQELMKDMFGYIDGPKYQTNDEKVLAAGFDLKTSFRKM